MSLTESVIIIQRAVKAHIQKKLKVPEQPVKVQSPAKPVPVVEEDSSDIELPEMFDYEGLWFQLEGQAVGKDTLAQLAR